jgi:hypothetical protein
MFLGVGWEARLLVLGGEVFLQVERFPCVCKQTHYRAFLCILVPFCGQWNMELRGRLLVAERRWPFRSVGRGMTRFGWGAVERDVPARWFGS